MFIAVELPDAVRETLHRGLGRLKRDQPPARWVRPEAMHLTLKFLGEQPDELIGRLDAAVPEALGGFSPVTVRLVGGGFFPGERRPRVAWVGGDAGDLPRWAGAIEDAGAALGLAREGRPFSLHLTLARLERPWGSSAIEHFLVEVGKWSLPPFEARETVLFSSELRPGGAVYTALRRWRVGGGSGDGA